LAQLEAAERRLEAERGAGGPAGAAGKRAKGSSTGRGKGSARNGAGAEVAVLRALVARALAEATDIDDRDHEQTADAAEDGWDADEAWDERDAWSPDPDDAEGTPTARGRWASRRKWEAFEDARPIPVEGGLAARTKRGPIGSTWWSQRFLGAIESVLVGGRLERGRSYARRGQVIDLAVRPGLVEAQVQGSRATPYRVRLAMPVVPDADWEQIIGTLGAQAGYAARMLAGELPHEVEAVFGAEGASLFPGPGSRLTTDCTCPDWANPCKHIAAVCYLVAEEFDRDPFAVLAWRGRDRAAVLGRLRALRGAATSAPTEPIDQAAHGPAPSPLADSVLGFWKAGPELADVRVRPEAAQLPGAVLRHLARGLLEVRGHDVGALLDPAYADLAAAAARRSVEAAGEG
jgi:uncharacterized Zn finger protein